MATASKKKKASSRVVVTMKREEPSAPSTKRARVSMDEESIKARENARMEAALKETEEEEAGSSEEEDQDVVTVGLLRDILSALKSIDTKLGLLSDPRSPESVGERIRRESLSVPERPAMTSMGTSSPSPFSTENGVRLNDEVYLVFVPDVDSTERPGVYEGIVTSISSDGQAVSVFVALDSSEDEYDATHVFLRNEKSREAAEKLLHQEMYGVLEVKAEEADIIDALLSDSLDVDEVSAIPHRKLIGVLARAFKIRSFDIEGKGEERKQEIIRAIATFKETSKYRVKALQDQVQRDRQAWRNAQAERGADETLSPKSNGAESSDKGAPSVGDFIAEPGIKDWYRIIEVRKNDYLGMQEKSGIKKSFKGTLAYRSRTAKKKTPIWNFTPAQ